MSNSTAICTGTVTNAAGNIPVCSVPWSSAPYSYSASIADTMTVPDIVELSWMVVACLAAAWLYKIYGRAA